MAGEDQERLRQATDIALDHHRAGRFSDAERAGRAVLAEDPSHAGALRLLGLLALQGGRHDDAIELIGKSLQRDPLNAAACNNLGNALYAAGRLEEAVQQYRRTLEMRPEVAATRNNLGKALAGLGQATEAELSIRRALELDPDLAEAHHDLGILCQRRAAFAEAERHFRRALELKPRFAAAHYNLAVTLKESGRRALAEQQLRLALEAAPAFASAHVELGILLRDSGRGDEARAQLRHALALDVNHAGARWALAMAQLPIVPDSQTAAERGRAGFAAEIPRLDDWFDAQRIGDAWTAVGTPQPFYLAYREQNNRDLLSGYGRLCARLMGHWQHAQGLPMLPPAVGPAVRVGVVSAQFADHSVWHALIKGWLRHLDRGRFELDLFALDPRQDQETQYAKSHSAHFDSGERSLRHWAEAIRGRRPDALIFPEIGMHAMALKIASLRLAPVQIAAWGHPETTGLPTIDYFLSAQDLEPPGAQENYTEKLVLLPNLGCCYQPSRVEPAAPELADIGIDADAPLLICPGTPFKYAPAHDRVFPAIARALGRCRFVFFSDGAEGVAPLLRQRLERVFAQDGLEFTDYAVFIPWQPRAAFYGLMQRAHVFLDTIGFSGFNTAMQAVECGLPIVTREGRYLRGRLASGILKRIGLEELVVASEEDYVALVAKVALDGVYQRQIRARMGASRHVLYGDTAPVRALEDFLVEVTGRNSHSHEAE